MLSKQEFEQHRINKRLEELEELKRATVLRVEKSLEDGRTTIPSISNDNEVQKHLQELLEQAGWSVTFVTKTIKQPSTTDNVYDRVTTTLVLS